MGLIEHETQILNIFEEACHIMLPIQLRTFFANFLICENIQGNIIWEKYKKYFTENFIDQKENKALTHINQILSTEDMSCKDVSLPEPHKIYIKEIDENDKEMINYCKQKFNNTYPQLNDDQKYIFEQIKIVNIKFYRWSRWIWKNILIQNINILFYYYKHKILSMAWTRIASILLPKEMTSHRTFRLPLDLSNIESIFLQHDSDKR